MIEQRMEFHRVGPDDYPTPYPAATVVPDWLRQLPFDPYAIPGEPATANRRAMLRAAEFGQMLPLVYETIFDLDAAGVLSVQTGGMPVDSQYPAQIRGSPFEGHHVAKFLNPWIAITPPGYSSLYLHPLAHYQSPFEMLAGLVETDTYYREVLLPTICLMRPTEQVKLDLASPLAQVIPVKREPWRMKITAGDKVLGTEAPEAGEQLIEFITPEFAPYVPPVPAIKVVPEWLKKMPNEAVTEDGKVRTQTVKKCPPFIEAVTMGYLLSLENDLELTMHGTGNLSYRANGPVFDERMEMNWAGTPLANLVTFRLRTPWRVKTPPGYAAMILPLLNRFEIPLQVLPGWIDADTDHEELVIPVICRLPPGSQYLIPRGTPIAQVVPIERIDWKAGHLPYDVERREAMEELFIANEHHYKDAHWIRKSYL